MSRPPFIAFHRPVMKAGVNGPDAVPIADWTRHWEEARNVLLAAGYAFYVYGLLVLHPAVDIEMETQYG
jgi:hypothetical protein